MRPSLYLLCLALISLGLLAYSQSTILDWDEGFHLVAASLIAAGKRPYLDFCFPQPPLHACWNALWLSLTGTGWRVPQAVDALLTSAAIALTAGFVARGGSVYQGCVATLLVGLNPAIWEFGTKAQAYGACTFLVAGALVAALSRRAFLSGCLAGAAAGCSLLTAPAALVLLVWHSIRRQWTFLPGLILASVPILVAFARAPSLTWFNLVEFHTSFRNAGWNEIEAHDFQVLTAWIDCGPALILVLSAAAGFCFARKNLPTEFRLAAWMTAALCLEAAVARPTFPQYFIFVVPLLGIPAAAGFTEAATRLSLAPRWALAGLALLLLPGLSTSLLVTSEDNNTWTVMESLAAKITQVSPPGGLVLADPPVYVALHRLPPSGMEFPMSHAVTLPPARLSALHIVSQADLERRVHAGDFAVAETCKGDEEEIEALQLPKLYSQSWTLAGCTVYWGLAPHVLSF